MTSFPHSSGYDQAGSDTGPEWISFDIEVIVGLTTTVAVLKMPRQSALADMSRNNSRHLSVIRRQL
jgi:predicted RNA-binding protein with PUA-like domain